MNANLRKCRDRIEAWKQAAARPEPACDMIYFVTCLSEEVRRCRWSGEDPKPWRSLYEAALEVMQKWWPAKRMRLADLRDVSMYDGVVYQDRLESVRGWTDRRKLPILLLRKTEGRLELRDGHHRLKIARKLGERDILAIVADDDQHEFTP